MEAHTQGCTVCLQQLTLLVRPQPVEGRHYVPDMLGEILGCTGRLRIFCVWFMAVGCCFPDTFFCAWNVWQELPSSLVIIIIKKMLESVDASAFYFQMLDKDICVGKYPKVADWFVPLYVLDLGRRSYSALFQCLLVRTSSKSSHLR